MPSLGRRRIAAIVVVAMSGTVRYGAPQPAVLGTSRVKQGSDIVTRSPRRRASLDAGDVALAVDGRPVFVLPGAVPMTILTFLLLPMALVGGVLAVWLGDGVLSLGSLVGFLTVFGIAARNGILMVSHFQHLERPRGRGLRAVARAPRREGAPGADPDDRVRDGPGPRAAGGRRQPARS
jgi:hypothetical protein